ncbi:extracellular solute-binding protein [Kaistia nematophila]|uniref:Extracellular solute-binding protein n=1 Tax=Kaistia nematophila TaxID=2994654 RepID=A0A9X3IMP3_9HYPH|nr:extracellular solute-binding protein [Kaistia nematophila]MCX5570140.1 extracellular solute-binding protein [Kaistia nematophila]
MTFRTLFGAAIGLALSASTALADVTVKWLHLNTDPDVGAAWSEIVKNFEASHPGVKVEMQFLENEAFKAKLPTLLQSNDPPHLFYTWGGGVLAEQARTGAIKDLTEAMDADGGKLRAVYNPALVNGLSVEGKVYALPYQTGLVSFYYNKALFEKAGVDAASIKNWDDFLAAVKKLKDAGITPIAGGGGEKWPIHFYWGYLAMREGGKAAFDAAKANEGDGFKSEAFVKAGQDLAALGKLEPFQQGYLGATWPQTIGAFGDGKAAMVLGFESTVYVQANSAADGKGLAKDQIGTFAFPLVAGGAGQPTDTMGGINGWVLTKNAPPEAVEFAAFLTNPDSQKLMAAKNLIIPAAVGVGDAVGEPLIKNAAQGLAASTWHQNFLDQDLGPAVGRVVNDVSVEIVSGQMSPEDAAQQIQDAWALEN